MTVGNAATISVFCHGCYPMANVHGNAGFVENCRNVGPKWPFGLLVCEFPDPPEVVITSPLLKFRKRFGRLKQANRTCVETSPGQEQVQLVEVWLLP